MTLWDCRCLIETLNNILIPFFCISFKDFIIRKADS